MLQRYLFDTEFELTGLSIITSAAYNIKSLTSTICHTCHQLNRTEDILPVLRLPVLKDFPTSLAKVLETESWFGPMLPTAIFAQV